MKDEEEAGKEWYLGHGYGLLNGISMRPDVPNDVRKVCAKAVSDYLEFAAERGVFE